MEVHRSVNEPGWIFVWDWTVNMAETLSRSGPFVWKRAVYAPVLPCLTVDLWGSSIKITPNNWSAPANCSAVLSQRLHRGMHPAQEQLWIARTSCYQTEENASDCLCPSEHFFFLLFLCRSVRVCLGILAVSVCRRGLLNYQWIIGLYI